MAASPTDMAAGPPPGTGGEERRRPPTIIVRYGAMNWIGEFVRRPNLVLAHGAKVVVQTERGIELGENLGTFCNGCGLRLEESQVRAYVETSGPEFCRFRAGKVLRQATADDLVEQTHLDSHINDDIAYCAEQALLHGLDMKVVTAEHLLGGERIIFYFSSPARVDFRQLVRELAHRYRTRIEMRQVGARDEARLVADFEVCGRECCCRNFLKKLRPVNMKMAKLQKSTLDPSKVSGRCGRLRCCLRYEHLGYEELAKRLPRMGTRVRTDAGVGVVTDVQVLTQLVMLRTEDERLITVPLDEIREFNVSAAPPKPVPPPPPAPPPAPAPPAREPRAAAPVEGEKRSGRRSRRRRRGGRGRSDERGGEPGPPAEGTADAPGPTQDIDSGDEAASPEAAEPAAPARDDATPAADGPRAAGDEGAGRRSGRNRRRRRRR